MKKMNMLFALMVLATMGANRPVKAEDNILFNVGTVKVLLPFSDVSAVYLFDGVAKQSLVGAETPLITWHKLTLTGGAVTSIDGAGSPFAGIHLELENPVERWTSLAGIKPGVFGGRNFNTNEWMAGVTASVSIFN